MILTVAPSSVQIAWISILFPEPSGPASKTDLSGHLDWWVERFYKKLDFERIKVIAKFVCEANSLYCRCILP